MECTPAPSQILSLLERRLTDAGFLKLVYQQGALNFECTMRDKACSKSAVNVLTNWPEVLRTRDASVLFWAIQRAAMLDAWVV